MYIPMQANNQGEINFYSSYFKELPENCLNHLYSNDIDQDVLDTTGQAETAFIGINEANKRFKLEGSTVIHNIDTILYNRNISSIKDSLKINDGHIDIFKSNNHAYSYVMIKNGFVTAISEKILISDMATSGLYGFASPQLFLDNYNGELYISDIYKKLITNGLRIHVSETHDEKDTIVLGTPSDYISHSN